MISEIQGVNFVFVCDKCTIISKMQNMYKYTNYIFCINRVLHVNHTLFYRKFKNIKRYTEHLL